MYCNKCGQQQEENSKFCRSCSATQGIGQQEEKIAGKATKRFFSREEKIKKAKEEASKLSSKEAQEMMDGVFKEIIEEIKKEDR